MSDKLNIRHRFAHEPLEDRCLLAGDVSARIIKGELVVCGDRLANAIEITAGVNPGEVVVTGQNDGIGDPTSVNGDPNGAVTLTGFTRGIFVDLKRGDDIVRIVDLVVPRSVCIYTCEGNDQVILGEDQPETAPNEISAQQIGDPSVDITRDLFIYTGKDNDLVEEFSLRVGKHNDIYTDGGDDIVLLGVNLLDDPSDFGVECLDHLFVEMGKGDDSFLGEDVRVVRNAWIWDAGGNNDIVLFESSVGGKLDIWTGSGIDNVALEDVDCNSALIATGKGNDTVEITDSNFTRLSVFMEKGDDTLSIGDTTVTDKTLLDGGPGTNNYSDLGGNSLGVLTLKKFIVV